MVHLKQPKGEFVVNLFSGRMKHTRADTLLLITRYFRPQFYFIFFVETVIKDIVFKLVENRLIITPLKVPLTWSLKNGMSEVMITVQGTE